MHVKDVLREKTRENPDALYPTKELRKAGFMRKQCTCGSFFWTAHDHETCGEPACSGGYRFLDKAITGDAYDYPDIWRMFADHMEQRDYTPIKRYPVAARWRNDTDFVQASIYNFQPHVVNGTVEPPANPLVVPQPSLRFNDIDNVGITGRHFTTHVHIGQHAFVEPEAYDQEKYFRDLLHWFTQAMEIPKRELTVIEDAWSGGGNAGISLEVFSNGLELGNQVYMFYAVQNNELKELDLQVLDMGMGQERCCWLSQDAKTSYEAVMPETVAMLRDATGLAVDEDVWTAFLPHAGILNVDEVEDIEATWESVANAIGIGTERLKREVLPARALYAIADHARSILFAITDGVLPSNAGGGYNIRMLLRRCHDLMAEYDWDIDLMAVMETVAEELAPQYPEIVESLPEIEDILAYEERKYRKTLRQAERIVSQLDAHDVDEEKLIELYDSEGIPPDMVADAVNVAVPSDFYAKVAARHEEKRKQNRGEGVNVEGIPETDLLFRKDPYHLSCDAEVVDVEDGHVILNQTVFYPTSGGQEHDTGVMVASGEEYEISGAKMVENRVLHETDAPVEEGERVTVRVDEERRKQLTQHHDATHIINGLCKKLLGRHVWQAGAHKGTDKARLDITHYKPLTEEELGVLEERANNIVETDMPIEKEVLERTEAEKQYGFTLYQGGYVPGRELRVVKIGDVDVEACGGTHYDATGETGPIVVLGSTKVQDGVVRIEFKAGKAAEDYRAWEETVREKLKERISFDALDAVCNIFDVSRENVVDVVDRFIAEWEEQEEMIAELDEGRERRERPQNAQKLFESWKEQQKTIERLKEEMVDSVVDAIRESDEERVRHTFPFDDLGMFLDIVNRLESREVETAALVCGMSMCAAYDPEKGAEGVLEERCEKVDGSGHTAKGFVCDTED